MCVGMYVGVPVCLGVHWEERTNTDSKSSN